MMRPLYRVFWTLSLAFSSLFHGVFRWSVTFFYDESPVTHRTFVYGKKKKRYSIQVLKMPGILQEKT